MPIAVQEIFTDIPNAATRVWISERAADEWRKQSKPGGNSDKFVKKLREAMKNGFPLYELSDWPPVKYEGGGVHRFGIRPWLFRLIGFYNNGRSEFIVMDAFLKSGQKLKKSEQDRVDAVATIKRTKGSWVKV